MLSGAVDTSVPAKLEVRGGKYFLTVPMTKQVVINLAGQEIRSWCNYFGYYGYPS